MVKSRTFTTSPTPDKPEKVTFSINDETFAVKPQRSAATILSTIGKLTSEDAGPGAIAAVIPFIEGSVVPEDIARLRAALYSDEAPLTTEDILGIGAYLFEVYAARPTKG